MSTLFARLSAALLVIILLVGSSFYFVELFSTRMYYEELTQRLNSSIAMYVTGERDLIEDGEVKTNALELLAQQAMIINPTVEVYLLDKQGPHSRPRPSARCGQIGIHRSGADPRVACGRCRNAIQRQ